MTTTIKLIGINKAQVTKAFAKKAVIFGTEEYKLWREFKQDFPNAEMVTKSIKRNPNKKTNRNMTYDRMKLYIGVQKNAVELMEEFERQSKLAQIAPSPYHAIVAWFNEMFDDTEDYKRIFNTKNETTENESDADESENIEA